MYVCASLVPARLLTPNAHLAPPPNPDGHTYGAFNIAYGLGSARKSPYPAIYPLKISVHH